MIFYLRCWFPSSVRARTVAWFMMAGPLSGVFGGPISGALLGIHHAGLAGWQWLFLIEGLPAVVLGVVAFFYLTDAPEKALWLRADQRAWLVGTLSEEVHPDPAVQGRDLFCSACCGQSVASNPCLFRIKRALLWN